MIEITKDLVKQLIPVRKQNSNKGDYGKVLNIAGSEKYFGAGVLCSLAALKTGAGYSIFCSQEKVISLFEKFSPDLIYKSHENFDINIIKDIIEAENISSVVLGCGISTENQVLNFVEQFTDLIKNKNIPVVIDADGLNCLAKLNMEKLNNNFILTPHPKELSRLLNMNVEETEQQRELAVKSATEKYNCTVILKGHNTLIATKDNIYKNITGNSALAKAGTGDVLAGMIGGFLAQKTTPQNAAVISVYLHGLAANIYTENFNEYSLLASELLNYIPLAINKTLCKE